MLLLKILPILYPPHHSCLPPTPCPLACLFLWPPPPSDLHSVAVCFRPLACSPSSLLVFLRPLYTHCPSAGPGPCSPGQSQRLPHPDLVPEPTAQLKAQAATYVGNYVVEIYQQYKNVP